MLPRVLNVLKIEEKYKPQSERALIILPSVSL